LENRTTPAAVLVTAADAGGGPHVIVRTDSNGDGTADAVTASFMAFDPAFAGGVRVATGDFDGDGRDELVTAAGPGGGPHVQVWDLDERGAVSRDPIDSCFAFDPGFQGGAWLATGDFDQDGKDELVISADAGGGPHVKVYSDTNADGRLSDNPVDSFYAYDPAFAGGVRIAVGRFDANGIDYLVTAAGPGGGSHVKVFDNRDFDRQVSDEVVMNEFLAFDTGFTGGVFVATRRVLAGRPGPTNFAVSAGGGGGPHLKLFRAMTFENIPPVPPGSPSRLLSLELRDSFFAYGAGFRGGVRAAFADLVPNDASVDLVTAPGPGNQSQVKISPENPETGQVSKQPLADAFAAFTAPDGEPLPIGVFVAFGTT
jgi:hypothetical protein